MDDQPLVGELDGGTDLHEEAEAFGDRQVRLATVVVDGLALDVLHDEVGHAAGHGAAVDQPRDVGVIELREDLPLALEPRDAVLDAEAEPDHLDRRPALERLVHALGQVDGAHAAAADAPQDPVRPDVQARQVRAEQREPVGGGRRQEGARRGIGVEQGAQLARQRRRRYSDMRAMYAVALGLRQRQGEVEDVAKRGRGLGHGCTGRGSRRRSGGGSPARRLTLIGVVV